MLLLIPADLITFGIAMADDKQHKVVLLLGSNQGDKAHNLKEAIQLIELKIGIVHLSSSVYETEPWGFESDDGFLNQAIIIKTGLRAGSVLDEILGIEKQMGRERILNFYTSRLIDIDIVFFDQQIIEEPDLIIPHPLMQLRRFVLVPLNEIIPDFIHPVIGKTIRHLMNDCEDTLNVKIAS